jgi:hypothetical protein
MKKIPALLYVGKGRAYDPVMGLRHRSQIVEILRPFFFSYIINLA